MNNEIYFNMEAEYDMLSILLNNPKLLIDNPDKLREELFADPFCRKVLELLKQLIMQNSPITISAITKNRTEQGHLKEVKVRNIAVDFFDHFYTILDEAYIARKIQEIAHTSVDKLTFEKETPSEVLGRMQSFLDGVNEKRSTSIVKGSDIVDGMVAGFAEEKKEEVVVSTPFEGFNELLLHRGFAPSSLVVVAGIPSTGKTELALNFASFSAITHKKHVFIYSLEMEKESLVERILAEQAQVESLKMARGQIGQAELDKIRMAAAKIKQSTLLFEDNLSGNIYDVISSIRKANNQHKLDMVIIDYLQLITVSHNTSNDTAALTEITRALKRECVKLRIPFIVLSQLSRQHQAEGREPDLRDLRGSGSIEQDADLVLFLHAAAKEKQKPITMTKVLLKKQRNGPTGEFWLENIKPIQKFVQADKVKAESDVQRGNVQEDDLPF